MTKSRDLFSPAQARAARALLDWSADRLAEASRVEVEAIELFEAGHSELSPRDLRRLGTALTIAGVIALQPGLGGAGVRFRRTSTSPAARWAPWLGPD